MKFVRYGNLDRGKIHSHVKQTKQARKMWIYKARNCSVTSLEDKNYIYNILKVHCLLPSFFVVKT